MNECCVCHEMVGTLELENGEFICEECAQVMSELGNEMDE